MEHEQPADERIATVEGVRFSGTISFVDFSDGESQFQLVGDSRMLQPLYDYIGKLVSLNVRDFDNWSWQPLEEPNDSSEEE